jgi:hypothetical protein
MAALAEQSVAGQSNFKNSSGERNGNGYGLLQEQRHFFELVLTATATTRKTDQNTATTATEKTTLNQVHSGPKDWEYLILLAQPGREARTSFFSRRAVNSAFVFQLIP